MIRFSVWFDNGYALTSRFWRRG